MSKKVYAIFSDKAYHDFINGLAVDNNGLRSPKGSFYSDQPSFKLISERTETLKNAGTAMLIAVGGYIIFEIALPETKRFAHEKAYPFVVEKWDNWQEKRKEKKAKKQTAKKRAENAPDLGATDDAEKTVNCRIIDFNEYLKMA